MKQSSLKADPEKVREFQQRARRNSKPKRGAVSPASTEQRLKVMHAVCANCAGLHPDPAHLTSRSQGGCDDSLCVVPLCRECHNAFDEGHLDLAPLLALREFSAERAHMATHLTYPQALHRLTGLRWVPEPHQEGWEA